MNLAEAVSCGCWSVLLKAAAHSSFDRTFAAQGIEHQLGRTSKIIHSLEVDLSTRRWLRAQSGPVPTLEMLSQLPVNALLCLDEKLRINFQWCWLGCVSS